MVVFFISKVQIFLYLLLLMVVNMYKHMGKVEILQGSAVTLTTLIRWANYPSSGCKFPTVYMCQKL